MQTFNSFASDVFNWTSEDPRQSILFAPWGVVYRFQVRIYHLHPVSPPSLIYECTRPTTVVGSLLFIELLVLARKIVVLASNGAPTVD